ncbi:conserved hypothetical protein [Rubrivivax sp. A210]|nr:conserved hypothetical protein [Rubrivivax sp. A210]
MAGHAFLFTLLLVGLMGVGLLVASEVDSTITRREREQALLQIGREFREALARYTAARGSVAAGQYPQRLEDLLLDPRHTSPVRHLRRLYADPLSGKAEWGLVRDGGRIVGVHSLSALEPLKQDDFDPDEAGFKGARRYREWVFMHPATRVPPAAQAASAPLAGASRP